MREKNIIFSGIILITTLVSFIAHVAPAFSASAINARYQSVSQNKVVFLVEVGTPTPSNLIIIHSHPAGNPLIKSSPSATKPGGKSGVSKWLLKNVKPGVYPFSLYYSNPVSKNAISLSVRHRDRNSGNFKENVVRP